MPFLYLSAGLFIGVIATWLVMKNRIALATANARTVGEVDRIALNERLKFSSLEGEARIGRIAELEGSVERLRTEKESFRQQCAQFGERVRRLEATEAELRVCEERAAQINGELADLRVAHGALTTKCAAKDEQLTELKCQTDQLVKDRAAAIETQATLQVRIEGLNVTLENERKQTSEKLGLLNDARAELTMQFKNLANEILEEKSKKFTDQNKTNLNDLLSPLKERIDAFQKKVEDCYEKEGKDRTALGEQVKMLTELNNKLSQDAQNLTLALKGDRKAQGNWGEIILEDILERAGLIAGQHYDIQIGIKSEDGQSHVIPDIVVHLPGKRDIVIDSKFTLPDYRAFVNAESDEDRHSAMTRLLVAIRDHMNGLCEKQYQSLYGLKSLDCVVMFVPLEPAFMLAVTNDRELFYDAWGKNVLLVSPSTLLFVIRTIAYLWRQDGISRNAQDISRRGGELYDKLVSFVNEIQKVGDRLNAAVDSYNEARKKLSEGRGNVIRQAELLKKLGVHPSKSMPPRFVDLSGDDDDSLPPTTDGLISENPKVDQTEPG